MALYKLQIK